MSCRYVMDSDFSSESTISQLDCGTVLTMLYHVSAKDRQYNDIKNKDKKTKHGRQNTTQKTKE